MALPQAVQRQNEAADRLAAEAGMKGAPTLEDKPAKPEGDAAPATPVVESAPAAPTEDWEKRYKGYKASTDATIAELRNAQAQIMQQNQTLQEQMKAMQAQANPPAPEPVVIKDVDLDKLPDELKDLREEYDDSYLKNIMRLAQYQSGQEISNLKAQLKQANEKLTGLESSVQGISEQESKTARQLYYETLDEKVPNWEKIGESAEFSEWLKNVVSAVDPRTYGEILSAADKSADATQTFWVLTQYQNQNQGSDAGNELDAHLTPEGSGSGDGVDTPQVDPIKESEISQFYADVTKGIYTPEEATAKDKQIQAAIQAGAVIQG